MVSEILNAKSSKSFRKSINFFMFKPKNKNYISFDVWYDYLKNLYSSDQIVELYILDVYNLLLDDDISLEEVHLSLKNCKKNKAPGFDSLSAKFYQNLPEYQLLFLTRFFNSVLHLYKNPRKLYSNIFNEKYYSYELKLPTRD